MPFRDYSATPANNTEIGDSIYIGPNMARNDVRESLQTLAADGKDLSDTVDTLATDGINTDPLLRADIASTASGKGAALIGEAGGSTLQEWLDTVARQPQLFGVVGDEVADDTTALQAWADFCEANGLSLRIDKPLICKVSSTLSINPAKYLNPAGYYVSRNIDLSNLTLRQSGARNYIMLDIGEAPVATATDTLYNKRLVHSIIFLPQVEAPGALQWPGTLAGADTAIRLRNVWFSEIHCQQVYGFTKGIEFLGCPYNDIHAGTVIDCKYGRVWTTEGTDHDISFTNENRIWGGRIATSSSAASLGERYGDVMTWDKVASYQGQNNNRFIGVTYEIGSGNALSSAYEVPVWLDGVGTHNRWEKLRHESGKGPLAIIDGDGGSYGYANDFDVQYNREPGAGDRQQNHLLQVNGACGNIYTGTGATQSHWHSGAMDKLVASSGTANSYIKGKDFFYLVSGTPTLADVSRIDGAFGTPAVAHRNGVCLPAGGFHRVCVCLDASRVKDFLCSYDAPDANIGRPHFLAFDAHWNLLTGNATDATWGDEPYVKGASTSEGPRLAASGNVYITSQDEALSRALRVTVRDEVKYLVFGVSGGTNAAVVRGMAVTGYAAPNKPGSTYNVLDGPGSLRVFSLSDDDGCVSLASAKPDTAGKHGYYSKGQIVANSGAASAAAAGWQCTTAGWLCPAWAITTAYIVGQLVTNDTGKVYEATTAGTSAGAGGPTGTTATWDGITDGSVKWRYIGVLAVFTALASNP